MNILRNLLVFVALLWAMPANAVTCFWVGGTATWDGSNFASWATSTGGAGVGCPSAAAVPTSADTVTFDGASGGGTVTVNTTVNVTSITMGAFTGTLDFAANDNNVTVNTFNGNGSATRTLNMGDGLWTLAGTGTVWNFTTTANLTFNKNAANIVLSNIASSSTRTFTGGGLTYNNITFGSNTVGATTAFGSGVNNTFATIIIVSPNTVLAGIGQTQTATALSFATGSLGVLLTSGTSGIQATISVASGTQSLTSIAIRDIVFTGGATFTATGLDLGNNTGITITTPSGGSGGGGIIGGYVLKRDLGVANDNTPMWLGATG